MSAPHFPEPDGGPGLQVDETPSREAGRSWRAASLPLPAKGGPPSLRPNRWRHPVVGYAAAVVLTGLAVLLTWLLKQALFTLGFSSVLPLLAVAFVGLTWGAGPSILATLLGAVLLDYFLIQSYFSFSLSLESLVWLGVFVLVGLVISRLASQHKRARSAAETLAASLESERARLQVIFEAIPNPITFYDAKGTLTHANQAGEQSIGGRSLPTALDTLPRAFQVRNVQGDPLPVEQLPVARALRGETTNGIELFVTGSDGSDRILLTGAAPIRSRLGQIEGVVATSHDITELRQAEHEAARRRRQLQALLTLTDTALTHLALDDLLRELLGRLQEAMEVDDASILLLNEETQELYIHATHGLEEGEIYNVHIPMGQGFAGQIAASRQPLIVEDLSTFNVYHPFLKEHLHSVVGVPLLIGERLLGVVHVGTTTPRHFTDEEAQLLQRAADRVALALDRAALYASARAARSEAEQRAGELEAVIEAITDGVFIYGPQGETRVINTAAHTMMGLTARPGVDLLPYQGRFSLVEAYDANGNLMPLEHYPPFRVVHGETLDSAHSVDMRLHTLDGRAVQLNCTGAPIRDADGQQIGAVLVTRDVTERRHLEQRTEASLQALLDMAQALVEESMEGATTEQGGSVLRVVARRLAELACRVIGGQRTGFFSFEPETQLFRPMAVVGLSPEEEQQWLSDASQAHHLGENIPPELTERFAAGEVIVVDMRQPPLSGVPNPFRAQTVLAAPLKIGQRLVGELALDFGPDGHTFTPQEIALAGAVGKLAALIIERERLLREREEARASMLALTEANRRMDEFLGIASHELRTPLTKIKTSMQLAEHRVRTALRVERASDSALETILQPIQEMIRRGVRSVDVVNRLVGDLLDVSRIQSDRLEIRAAPVDLTQVVREAVEEQRELFPSRVITLTAPDEPVLVTADADRVGQVVVNYLTNAMKYSPSGRPVEVTVQVEERQARARERPTGARVAEPGEAKRPPPQARALVRDHGLGIPPEEQSRLWERFYQAQGVALVHGSSVGLGLGLYISKTIIERHGGHVGVENAPDEGAVFWFTLPLAEPRSSE
jgi:PAS domain S-box-containing protein